MPIFIKLPARPSPSATKLILSAPSIFGRTDRRRPILVKHSRRHKNHALATSLTRSLVTLVDGGPNDMHHHPLVWKRLNDERFGPVSIHAFRGRKCRNGRNLQSLQFRQMTKSTFFLTKMNARRDRDSTLPVAESGWNVTLSRSRYALARLGLAGRILAL